jgi:hypothetical protein
MNENIENLGSRKMGAEITELMAETMKINTEARWYPFIAGAGAGAAMFGAALGLVKLMFS